MLLVDGGDLFGPRNKNEQFQSEFLAEIPRDCVASSRAFGAGGGDEWSDGDDEWEDDVERGR